MDQGVCRPWTLHQVFAPGDEQRETSALPCAIPSTRRACHSPSWTPSTNRSPVGCRHRPAGGSQPAFRRWTPPRERPRIREHVSEIPQLSIDLELSIPQFSTILSASVLVDQTMTDEIMTLKEVAEYLKLAEKTAYRLAAEGRIPGFKVGGSWRFKKVDIDQWISSETRKQSGER